jgi:hypothetical protein
VSFLPSPAADAFVRELLAWHSSCSAQPVWQTIDTGQGRASAPSRWSTSQASNAGTDWPLVPANGRPQPQLMARQS